MSSTDERELTLQACAAGSEGLLALYHDFLAGRMPHAVLLTGESGVGKKTAARLLGQGLLCSSSENRPCGQCRDCRRFAARTHPDALFPAPAPREKTIKIDALRVLIDVLSRHSLEGGRRVVLIENAEKMTPQAQNCLLKTLEEAQAGTYFLLTADVETALLPTIRSRCRVIRIQPWPRERIEACLLRRGVPAARARALSLYCEGSPGRALQMQQDDGYWAARDTARRSFFSVESAGDLPAAARLLKDQKDAGDQLLDIVEQELRSLLHEKLLGRDEGGSEELSSRWHAAPPASLRALLEAVWAARRQKNANVGWAALSEGLLQTISEEASKWQV